MIYDYTLSTGDTTISGCILSGYSGQKDFAQNFNENFYYNNSLITGEKDMRLEANGQTFFQEAPTQTAATNQTVYQIFSGDFFVKTGTVDQLDNLRIYGSSTTPIKANYKLSYEKYTGKSAIGLGTAGANLGPALTSGISGIETSLNFIDYDYYLNGQKVYSGVGCGVSAGVGTQFMLNFESSSYGGVVTPANKSNFKAFAFIKRGRTKEITGSQPDLYGTGFIEKQTNFFLNGLKESDDIYLELYTGVTIVKTGISAGLFDFGINAQSVNLSL
jgi:hypothetical protein|tara:strand:- start:381 stop:1202 length:822 start_codon:yes stop_codon:yes gene_type:complete